MTTGFLTVEPGATLPALAWPRDESLTLLEGAGAVEVAGCEYALGPLDNLVVPAGLPRLLMNPSAEVPGVLARRLGRVRFSRPGPAVASAFNPFATAERSEAGPDTSFIDFFNETSMPGIEMSGGYGLFQPGGRLPAHVHDFDESICIIDGDADLHRRGPAVHDARGGDRLAAARAGALLHQRL